MALEHLNDKETPPPRVVVIGADGFVGGAVAAALKAKRVSVLAIASSDPALREPSGLALAETLAADDAVLLDLALPPVKTAAGMGEHLTTIGAVIAALKAKPIGHVVSVGTDAVYADAPIPITEASVLAPQEIHGACFLAREIALRSEVKVPLALLRSTLIYGAADTYNGYGPNRFRRLAAEGKEIVLGGEGEERRDHIAIEDVVALVVGVLLRRSGGALNLASGEVNSFRAVAELAIAASGKGSVIRGTTRQGPMAHGGYRPFDVAAVRDAFPDFRFTPLAEGMMRAARA